MALAPCNYLDIILNYSEKRAGNNMNAWWYNCPQSKEREGYVFAMHTLNWRQCLLWILRQGKTVFFFLSTCVKMDKNRSSNTSSEVWQLIKGPRSWHKWRKIILAACFCHVGGKICWAEVNNLCCWAGSGGWSLGWVEAGLSSPLIQACLY